MALLRSGWLWRQSEFVLDSKILFQSKMSLFIIIENVQTLKHKQVVQLRDVRRDIKICFYPKLTVLEKHLLT